LLAAHCAFVRGAERVIIIDREEDRLAYARERIPNGKVETINFKSESAWDRGSGASKVCSTAPLPDPNPLCLPACLPATLPATPFSDKKPYEALRELFPDGTAPDVCIEAVGLHYTTSWLHWFETALKLETDPSEIVNELIQCVRKGGRIAIAGAYAGGRRPAAGGGARCCQWCRLPGGGADGTHMCVRGGWTVMLNS
jgi:threonine dehydrogenase-like Zn-dependent dehydrogenase